MTRHCVMRFGVLLVLINQFFSSYAQEVHSNNIDTLMHQAIHKKAFPGAQLLIARRCKIILHKAYCYHTYDSLQKVELTHLYDLASMTKVLASTLSFMKAYEDYELDLGQKVKMEFQELKWRRKGQSSFKEILSHQAGWLPYITHQNKVINKRGEYRSKSIQY